MDPHHRSAQHGPQECPELRFRITQKGGRLLLPPARKLPPPLGLIDGLAKLSALIGRLRRIGNLLQTAKTSLEGIWYYPAKCLLPCHKRCAGSHRGPLVQRRNAHVMHEHLAHKLSALLHCFCAVLRQGGLKRDACGPSRLLGRFGLLVDNNLISNIEYSVIMYLLDLE